MKINSPIDVRGIKKIIIDEDIIGKSARKPPVLTGGGIA